MNTQSNLRIDEFVTMIGKRAVGLLATALIVASAACRESGQHSVRRADSLNESVGKPGGGIEVSATPTRTVVVNGIDLTHIGYDKGSAAAPLVLVEFSDFGCPYCREFARETFPAIDNEFIRTGKVYFKYVPFVIGMFPNATEASYAAECAGEQNKFWAMYDRLFEMQSEWKRERSPDPLLARYAAGIGLDGSRNRQSDGAVPMSGPSRLTIVGSSPAHRSAI